MASRLIELQNSQTQILAAIVAAQIVQLFKHAYSLSEQAQTLQFTKNSLAVLLDNIKEIISH